MIFDNFTEILGTILCFFGFHQWHELHAYPGFKHCDYWCLRCDKEKGKGDGSKKDYTIALWAKGKTGGFINNGSK